MPVLRTLIIFGAAGALAAFGTPASVQAAPIGPGASVCAADGPALLVRVHGFKQATGRLRFKLYNATSREYLGKTSQISRVVVPVSRGGSIDVCLPVPKAGAYVVSVAHDLDSDNKIETSDGGGVTGNPRISLSDAITGRKPPLGAVTVRVGGSTVIAPVRLMYKQGLSVGPVRSPV